MGSEVSSAKGASPAVKGAVLAVTLLTGLNLLNYMDRYVLAGVQPLVQSEFHISDSAVGALSMAFFIVYTLTAPLTGWLGDHFPRKPLLVAGALLWSIATLFTATVHSYGALYFRHAIVGIGEASFSIFAPALISDLYPEADRNRILTRFYIAIPFGSALGYILGGLLGQKYGWRYPFYVAAIPGTIIALLFLFLVKEPKRGASERVFATPDRSTVRGLLRNRGYQTAVFGMAMMTFSIGGIAQWMPTFLHRIGGYSVGSAGEILGAITVVTGLAGTATGGWLADRMIRRNHRALYLVSAWSVLLAVPFALIAFFGPKALILPGVALAQFFLWLNTGPLNAAIVNSVSAGIRSTALAVELFMIHALGDVPSPKLIGIVSDHSNLRLGLGITLIAMVISSVAIFFGARFAPMLPDNGGGLGEAPAGVGVEA